MIEVPFRHRSGRFQLLLVLAAGVWIFGAMLAWPGYLIGDEWVHFHQIDRFRTGDTRVFIHLTTIPGFHWLLAGGLNVLDAHSLGAARLLNASFAAGAIGFFYLARRRLHAADALRATAQFAVLPVLVPFAFLAYTDASALLFVLVAVYAALCERHGWASVAMIVAMAMRQNNVAWVPLLAVWSVWNLWQAAGWRPWLRWKESIRIAWPYALPILAFLGYWWWRGSISFSSQQAPMHPDGALHVGNPLFALAIVACLLPIQTLAGIRSLAQRARRRLWWLLVPLATLGVFVGFFAVDHPYNFIALGSNVRNVLLQSVATERWAWAAFGALATAGACSVAGNGFVDNRGWLFAPFAFLCLAASWLIEPRYSLVPLAIYLLLRKPSSPSVESGTLALWSILAVITLVAIFGFRLMI